MVGGLLGAPGPSLRLLSGKAMHPSSNEPGETNALTTACVWGGGGQWVAPVVGFWVGDILWSFHIELNMNEWVYSTLVLVDILEFS